MGNPTTTRDAASEVAALGPHLWKVLADLVRLASISGTNPPKLAETARTIAGLFTSAGVSSEVRHVGHGGKISAPLVYGHMPAPAGAPTVLLYAHYDVQPADVSRWKNNTPFTPQFENVDGDVRMVGRGAADDKSGVVMHLGAIRAIRALRGRLPVGVKVVVEGEEETGESMLDSHLAAHPEDPDYHADVVVVADTGNVRRGEPTTTTTLRGITVADVRVRTLDKDVHSGMYGGPAPDAFMALARMLATLHHANGDVAVPGLTTFSGDWQTVTEASFRQDATVREKVELIGSGSVQRRLYGKPSINVVGLSGPPTFDKPTNVLCATARARISVRLAPEQDPAAAFRALKAHLEKVRPWSVELTVDEVGGGKGFVAQPGRHHATIDQALRRAFGTPAVQRTGQGGSIPLVNALKAANEKADIVLWGCEEPLARIHGNDESVSRSELERMTLAEALLIDTLNAKEH